MRIVRTDAGGPENRDRLVDRGERVEAFDEFAHDTHHTPRVGSGEIDAGPALLQQLLVFGDGARIADRVVHGSRRTRPPSPLSRRRSPTSFEVSLFSALSQTLQRLLFG